MNASGVIINTGGWVEGEGYTILLHCIKEFKVDVVLALGQDRLFSRLKADVPPTVTMVKIDQSGGVVPRSSSIRRKDRMLSIREYFYGKVSNETGAHLLSPSALELSFDDVEVYRIVDLDVSDAMLPVGQTASQRLHVVKADMDKDLSHALVSVAHVTQVEESYDKSFLINAVSAGFICMYVQLIFTICIIMMTCVFVEKRWMWKIGNYKH